MQTIPKLSCLVAGEPVVSDRLLTIKNPYDGTVSGTVALAGKTEVEAAVQAA